MTDQKLFLTALALAAMIGAGSAEDRSVVVAGLAWDDDSAIVHSTLAEICREINTINATPVQFPLARASEEHVLCFDMQLPAGKISSAVFVVADDALKMIEARGGAVKTLIDPREDEPMNYLEYQAFEQGQIFTIREADTVWFMSKEALHPNLFTWSNPLLKAAGEAMPVYNASAALPSILNMGGDIESLRPQFEASCPIMNEQKQKNAWLPHGPKQQTQINCFGFDYAGFPRKFEAVFADGVLELVWILTAKQEEGRVREALIDAFGPAEETSEKWERFHSGQIALRKDKPEILVISEKLTPYYRKLPLPE